MVVVPDAEHNIPYTADCPLGNQKLECQADNATQMFKAQLSDKYFDWCKAEPSCVAMLPFLWDTVHTSKYEIMGAADMPILLERLRGIGRKIKAGGQ